MKGEINMFIRRIKLLFGGLYGLLITSFNLHIMENVKHGCIFLVTRTVSVKGRFWAKVARIFAANTIRISKIQTKISIHADRLKQKLETELLKME